MEINKEKTVDKAGHNLLKISIKRGMEEGGCVVITLSSTVDWRSMFMRPNSSAREYLAYGGLMVPRFRDNVQIPSGLLTFNHGDRFESEGRIEGNILLAEGLASGVTYKFNSQPVSRDALKKFLENIKTVVTELYLEYLRPFDSGLEINTKTTTAPNFETIA